MNRAPRHSPSSSDRPPKSNKKGNREGVPIKQKGKNENEKKKEGGKRVAAIFAAVVGAGVAPLVDMRSGVEKSSIELEISDEFWRHAQEAGKATGVSSDDILAILGVESTWGKNVGQCRLRDETTGEGVRVDEDGNETPLSGPLMKPKRDLRPFMRVTATFKVDPKTVPLSCPIVVDGKQKGFGGAMGPAQVLPSTFEKIVEKHRKDIDEEFQGGVLDPREPRAAAFIVAWVLRDNGYERDREKAIRMYVAGQRWKSEEAKEYEQKVSAYRASIN